MRPMPGHLAHRFKGSSAARGALEAVWQHWRHTLGALQVENTRPGPQPVDQRLALISDPGVQALGA